MLDTAHSAIGSIACRYLAKGPMGRCIGSCKPEKRNYSSTVIDNVCLVKRESICYDHFMEVITLEEQANYANKWVELKYADKHRLADMYESMAVAALPRASRSYNISGLFQEVKEWYRVSNSVKLPSAKPEADTEMSDNDPVNPISEGWMSTTEYRAKMQTMGCPLNSDQDVCHIIAHSNGGADHEDNYFVAAAALNRSLGNRDDSYLAEVAGEIATKKAIAVSRTTGYKGPGAKELIHAGREARR